MLEKYDILGERRPNEFDGMQIGQQYFSQIRALWMDDNERLFALMEPCAYKPFLDSFHNIEL